MLKAATVRVLDDRDVAAAGERTGEILWRSPWVYEYLDRPIVGSGMVFIGSNGEGNNPASLYGFKARR